MSALIAFAISFVVGGVIAWFGVNAWFNRHP